MAQDRFSEIVGGYSRQRLEQQKREAAREEHNRALDQLLSEWMRPFAFPGVIDDPALESAAKRLVHVGAIAKIKFWDFRIAGFLRLAELSWPHELCLIILRDAISGDVPRILARLREGQDLLPSIIVAHRDSFEILNDKDAGGLPYTPPLSQKELAKILGVTYDTLRGDIKAGRWVHESAGRHQRLRQWRHQDQGIHARTLVRIRENFSEKIWRGSPR